MQRTIPGCGLDAVVPTRAHPDDDIIGEDGVTCKHRDAWYDCRGGAWHSADERHEADVEIVTDVLNKVDEWVCEYATENEDYATAYDHIVAELSHDWPDRIREWIESYYGDRMGHTEFDDRMDEVVEHVCEGLSGWVDWEPHYHSNEYAAYYGKGCCLWSTGIGEEESQLDINDNPVLKALHEDGRLDDVLDNVRSDAYVSRSKKRVLNEETGHYEYVGRETYDNGNGHPCLMTYHNPGGAWHFVVDEDRMEELVEEALEDKEDDDDSDN